MLAKPWSSSPPSLALSHQEQRSSCTRPLVELETGRRGASVSSSVRAASSPSCCLPRARSRAREGPFCGAATVAVTLSMAATPLLLLIDDDRWRRKPAERRSTRYRREGTVILIVAGSGVSDRSPHVFFAPSRIPFTALDSNVVQVDSWSLRRPDLLRRRRAARHLAGGAGRQGAGLRTRHRRGGGFA